jgi:hypothetical protein
MNRIEVGAIIEIETKKGLAYAQVTHRDGKWGYLLRVFSDLQEKRPEILSELVCGSVQFSTFYPVPLAAKAGLIKVIGADIVAEKNAKFPVFKNGIPDPETGHVKTWCLWDGKQVWRSDLSVADLNKLPYLEIITGNILHKRIEEGWNASLPSWNEKW